MGRIILHIGMHKTGSSSIQESLSRNLRDPRFRYIRMHQGPNHTGPLKMIFLNDPKSHDKFLKRGLTESDIETKSRTFEKRLRDQLSADSIISILSAEGLLWFKVEELERLYGLLKEYSTEVECFAYVRPSKSLMESRFVQRVKGGQGGFDFTDCFPDYTTIKKFDTVFGINNVRLKLFEPRSMVGNDAVLDFCSEHDIDFFKDNVIRTNEALSLPALSILYCYRKFGPQDEVGADAIQENKRLNDWLSEIPGPKFRLHSSIYLKEYEKNKDNVDWIEERLGCQFNEDIYVHDSHAVCNEQDLLAFGESAISLLNQNLPGMPVLDTRGVRPKILPTPFTC